MRHLIVHKNGHISVMNVLPRQITVGEDVFRVMGMKPYPDGIVLECFDKAGEPVLFGVAGAKDANDIQADSVPGGNIEFFDPADEIAKWVPEQRDSVASIVQDVQTPEDRTFRNAWEHDGVKVVRVNMPKARDIWRERMRKARAPLLANLDTQYMRADEAGDATTKKSIATQKQILRDVTADPKIEAATTPEELKLVWPSALV